MIFSRTFVDERKTKGDYRTNLKQTKRATPCILFMDDYDLENCYDEESQTVALEGEFDFEALETILEWLRKRVPNWEP